MACEVCDGRGYLLIDRDRSGHLEIQRCGSCDKYRSDSEATEACYNHALEGWQVIEAPKRYYPRG